jgi:hypothetical protein
MGFAIRKPVRSAESPKNDNSFDGIIVLTEFDGKMNPGKMRKRRFYSELAKKTIFRKSRFRVIFVSGWAEGRGVHSFSPKVFPIKKKRKAPEAPLKKKHR